MGEFSADWLGLRENADRRSRDAMVGERVVGRLAETAASSGRPVEILDLGTGTGSNVRYLVPQLPTPQRWRLVDRDVDLLRQVPKRLASWALDRGAVVTGNPTAFTIRGADLECGIETRAADLSKLGDPAFAPELWRAGGLVTASALLDLVSQRWLEALVHRCRRSSSPVLFVLTYDGRITFSPDDEDDEWIRALVNRHQRGVKGFGRALGPEAASAAADLFRAAGYQLWTACSDWQLTPADDAMQRLLIEGWATAAGEIAKRERDRCDNWLKRRLAWVDAGLSSLVVGHGDIGGWPNT